MKKTLILNHLRWQWNIILPERPKIIQTQHQIRADASVSSGLTVSYFAPSLSCVLGSLSFLWSCCVSISRSKLIPNFLWAHLGLLVLGPPVALRMMNRARPRGKSPRPWFSMHLRSASPSRSSCYKVECCEDAQRKLQTSSVSLKQTTFVLTKVGKQTN